MARTATVVIKSTLAGQIRQVAKATGTLEALAESIRRYAPQVPTAEVKAGLQKAAFEDGLVWIGNHSIGLELLTVSLPSGELVTTASHLDD